MNKWQDHRGTSDMPIVAYTDTKPKGPKTNYAHAKCYAGVLNDCCKTISKEHYISKAVMDLMGDMVKVTSPRLGFDAKELPPKAIAANILCKRHNEALSPLDQVAKRFFSNLLNIDELAVRGAKNLRVHLVRAASAGLPSVEAFEHRVISDGCCGYCFTCT